MNPESNSSIDWLRIFPMRGFRSAMSLRRGASPESFFNEPGDAHLLTERRRWYSESPEHYAGLEPNAGELLAEFENLAAEWTQTPREISAASLLARCVAMGTQSAPDWALMQADAMGVYRLAAGAVCFPSSWALRDKLGKPLDEIHGPVPGLNAELGAKIHSFLSTLPASEPWERTNFGFCANTELNHHPSRPLKKLSDSATLSATWLRLERQFLFKMPRTRGIVFGIRVSHHRLDELTSDAEIATRMAHTLQSMSAEMAAYKGLKFAQPILIAQLRLKSNEQKS